MALIDEYRSFIAATAELEPHARHDLMIACTRSILQTASLCVFDLAHEHSLNPETTPVLRAKALDANNWLCKDSQPIELLRTLLPHVRRGTNTDMCGPLDGLWGECSDFVEKRNDAAHGVPSRDLVAKNGEWMADFARRLLSAVADILPHAHNPPETRTRRRLLSVPTEAARRPFVFRRFKLNGRTPSVTMGALVHDRREDVESGWVHIRR